MDIAICIVGLGSFGQFLQKMLSKHCSKLLCLDRAISTPAVVENTRYLPLCDINTIAGEKIDIIVFAVSIASLETVLKMCDPVLLSGKLIVDVCSVKIFPKQLLSALLPTDCDLCCSHPMFGPQSARNGLEGQVFMFDNVRIQENTRLSAFLNIWKAEGCIMVEMSCEKHDEQAANTQFITHVVGRTLGQYGIERSEIDTASFGNLYELTEGVLNNSDDLFCGIYAFNPHAAAVIAKLRQSLDSVVEHLDKRKIELMKGEIPSNI